MIQNFSEEQLWILTLSLEKWECPLKFAYINEKWAKAWQEIEKQRTQTNSAYAESELLKNNIQIYLNELWDPKEVAIFDFWCGTGETVKWVLLKLQELWIKTNYHAFDISENIISLCKETIWNIWNNYSFDRTILDFETYNLTNILYETRKKYNDIPVLGMLLWNTIWNFDSMERIISNIMESFRIKDRLVIWIEKIDISNQKRFLSMMNWYQTDTVYDLIFSTLETIWVKKEYWTFNTIFNTKNNSVEWYFEANKDLDIKVWKSLIYIEKQDKIRLFRSAKLDEAQFAKLFLDLNLRIASIRTNQSNTFIEVLLSPNKY